MSNFKSNFKEYIKTMPGGKHAKNLYRRLIKRSIKSNTQKKPHPNDETIILPRKKVVKNVQINNELSEHLEAIIRDRRKCDQSYKNALKYAVKLNKNKENTDILKKEEYEKVLTGLNIDEISESYIKDLSLLQIPLREKSSFRVCLTTRTRKKQLGDFTPEWKLNHKIRSYHFIDALGIRRPWISEEFYKYTQIPQKNNIVIKPINEAGSRGIYMVYSPEKILDIRNKTYLSNWSELMEKMANNLATGEVKKNQWFLQELILSDEDETDLPRDLKFYCFYGKVALIKEVCRLPEAKRCWWTAEGEVTETGKYKKTAFLGNGVTPDQIKLLEYISSEIPAPFLRIDFLKTNEGIVFGEFTPRPGLFETFDKKTDQWLGDLFLEAEGRLLNDLLEGKPFENYKNFLKSR